MLDQITAITDWSGKGKGDSVLALDHYFDALLYFDEVHMPKAAISDAFAEACAKLASRFREPPFDEPTLVSKVDDGVYLLGDGIIAGYKSALNALCNFRGISYDRAVLGPIHEIADLRERQIVESMMVAHSAVQVGISGANSCLNPDYLKTEFAAASDTENSPVVT